MVTKAINEREGQGVSNVAAVLSSVTKAKTSHKHRSQGGFIPQVVPQGDNLTAIRRNKKAEVTMDKKSSIP